MWRMDTVNGLVWPLKIILTDSLALHPSDFIAWVTLWPPRRFLPTILLHFAIILYIYVFMLCRHIPNISSIRECSVLTELRVDGVEITEAEDE